MTKEQLAHAIRSSRSRADALAIVEEVERTNRRRFTLSDRSTLVEALTPAVGPSSAGAAAFLAAIQTRLASLTDQETLDAIARTAESGVAPTRVEPQPACDDFITRAGELAAATPDDAPTGSADALDFTQLANQRAETA